MTGSRGHYLWVWSLVLAASILVSCLGGCGDEANQGSIDDLFIRRYRVNIDEAHDVVQVVGEVENRGSARVAMVEVHATPRSASGSKRGWNKAVLENLGPGERRLFSLNVTTRGRTSSVELKLAAPPASP